MKILLCKSHFAGPVSGADETLVAYATHLHKGGHRLAVVLLYPPANADQYYARLKQAGIEVITITSYPLIHIILRNVKTLIFYSSKFLHLPEDLCTKAGNSGSASRSGSLCSTSSPAAPTSNAIRPL